MTELATRRKDRRTATVAEIKDAAWAEMQATESCDCSLRAVARRLGMAPSALYRYFASRDELLTALIVDAFDDLTATLAAAYRRARRTMPDQPAEVFVTVADSYRQWALDQPLRYQLIFGNPVGGYEGTEETTAASARSSQVLLDITTDLVALDCLDTARLESGLDPAAEASFATWSERLPTPLPPVALAVSIHCYAALHGAIQLEVNRHLPPMLLGNREVFLRTMRETIGSALRRPAVS